nr:protein PELPK1-like [Ipomoea batatas]
MDKHANLELRQTRKAKNLVSIIGSALGSPSPSADGPALGIAPTSVGGPVVVAASADGPAETSTIGTGKWLPSGTDVNGVGPGSGTSSGRTANTFGRSVSSMDTSSAVLTSFCIALRPLLKAQDGLSGLSASADVAGEQDGIRQDLLSQVRALQDPAPGLLGGLELAFELLDPQVPLRKGLLKGRHLSTVYFVPVFGPGEEAIRSPTSAVDHPLVFSGGGAAAQIRDSRAAGGSSPCFISTSITGIPTLPKPEIPSLPEIPKPELPTLPKPQLPEIPHPELPSIPKLPEFPEIPKPELPAFPIPSKP